MAIARPVPASSHKRRASVGPLAQFLLIAVIAATAALVYLARDVTLLSISRGTGVVAPFDRVRLVLSPISGSVARHEIREGMTVEEGQILFWIENTDALSEGDDALANISVLRATVARLEAEAAGADSISFPDEISESAAASEQRDIFDARRAKIRQRLQASHDAVAQNRLTITEQKAAAEQHEKARDLAKQELAVIEPLVSRGISPRLEFLRVKQKVQELEALREQAMLAVPRLEAVVEEAERRIQEVTLRARADARRELGDAESELAAALETVQVAARIENAEVRAPIGGTVKRLLLGPSGDKVREGQAIIEIAPPVVSIFVDANFPAAESTALRVDQKASVTLSVSGEPVAGILVAIDADISVSPQGSRYRKAQLRVDAGTPGFDQVTNAGLGVGVIVENDLPLLDYVLDTIAAARGGSLSWK